jgi:tRNA(fMet)-specific endonuclease VapC
MSYVLDTDTLIYFLKGQEWVVEHINRTSPDKMSITIINHTELLFGVFNSLHQKQNLEKIQNFLKQFEILPFCEEASHIFAKQKAILKKKGKIIADLDLMIASIVLKNKSILITNNTKHFERISELNMENWSSPK